MNGSLARPNRLLCAGIADGVLRVHPALPPAGQDRNGFVAKRIWPLSTTVPIRYAHSCPDEDLLSNAALRQGEAMVLATADGLTNMPHFLVAELAPHDHPRVLSR
jgi:hypothetical protein